jgi:TPR repeat protein
MSKAAEQGEAFAAENIGMCHFSGNCPPLRRDYAAACRWLLIAHGLGNGPTCNEQIQARIAPSEFQTAQDAASTFLRLHKLPRQR